MARLLNRPMSGSTDLVNLLGQRGQQQAQSSLAMSQPWTAAAQNIGAQTAKTLAAKYAADQARPAEAFKLLSTYQQMQQREEYLDVAKAKDKREASESAKKDVAGIFMQASNATDPTEQARIYGNAVAKMDKYGLSSYKAPEGLVPGSPEAYKWFRQSGMGLDATHKPKTDRERIDERERWRLGRDLTADESYQAIINQMEPQMRMVWGVYVNPETGEKKEMPGFAIRSGRMAGQIAAKVGPNGEFRDISTHFKPIQTSYGRPDQETIQDISQLIATGQLNSTQLAKRNLHHFAGPAARLYEAIHAPENFGQVDAQGQLICPECDGSGAKLNFVREEMFFRAGKATAVNWQSSEGNRLLGAFAEWQKNSAEVADIAQELNLGGFKAWNRLKLSTVREFTGDSQYGVLIQRWASLLSTLKSNAVTIQMNGLNPSDTVTKEWNEILNPNLSFPEVMGTIQSFDPLFMSKLDGMMSPQVTSFGTWYAPTREVVNPVADPIALYRGQATPDEWAVDPLRMDPLPTTLLGGGGTTSGGTGTESFFDAYQPLVQFPMSRDQ